MGATSRRGERLRPIALALGSMLLAIFPAKAEAATPLRSCLPPVVAVAVVQAVDGNGTLILRDRRVVKLEGLLLPTAPASLQRQAVVELKKLVSDVRVTLQAGVPKRDRYDRLRAQVILPDGRWLQEALLRHGLARVSIAQDRRECARELYAAEESARTAGIGLWALPEFAVRTPESLRWTDLGVFQIVEGIVLNVKVSGSRAYLNFGRNWRTDFTVTIAPEDMKTFRRASVDPYSYTGKEVRVRGYIDRLHGFEIEAASPQAIEMIK
jgi:micrococcal nuclease